MCHVYIWLQHKIINLLKLGGSFHTCDVTNGAMISIVLKKINNNEQPL